MSQVERKVPASGLPGVVPGRAAWPRRRFLGAAAGAALLTVAVMAAAAVTGPVAVDPAADAVDPAIEAAEAAPSGDAALAGSWTRPAVSADGLVDLLGVRVVQVALTGDGGLIDLRFQVVDPDKAAAIHDVATPPAVVDDRTTVVANELLMGHSHSRPFKAGLTYVLMFENPGNLVARGDTVSILLGNAQVDHVEVR